MHSRQIERSYKEAVEVLQSRRRQARPTEPAAKSADSSGTNHAKRTSDLRGLPGVSGMRQWLHRIGHSTTDLDDLNVIHVAGTKGKGSTCAWAESFLRSYGSRTGFPGKTGLYTSPHLIYPEERIRINFQPIAKDAFAKYFFEVWDRLTENNVDDPRALPRYLQLLLLVSLHAFIREGVQATIIETHHGGEYDSTNIIDHPVATIITPLGMDHIEQLGTTMENIAWHKAGIFRQASHALSAPQDSSSAAQVLRKRAKEKDTNLQFVYVNQDTSLPTEVPQLQPSVQLMNCSVALAAVRGFLELKTPSGVPGWQLSDSDILKGIRTFSWPGRFQLIVQGDIQWFLDCAHNEMSVKKAAEWFIVRSQDQGLLNPLRNPKRVLIFGQVSNHRDPVLVLKSLATRLEPIHIHHAIFTSKRPSLVLNRTPENVHDESGAILRQKAVEVALMDAWRRHYPDCDVSRESNIEKALGTVRRLGAESGVPTQTLITGSQHLVGGALFSLTVSV